MTSEKTTTPRGTGGHRANGSGYGLIVFAGILLFVLGFFNMLYGAAAIANSISPNLIVPPHPVQQTFARQRVDRPVERHPIDLIGKSLHDLRSAQRLAGFHKNSQNIEAHRRAA